MTVYVDDYRCPYRGMRLSHMTADSLEELHAMAEKIGLKREWFQAKALMCECHYDVSDSMRGRAIKNGAVAETTMDGARRRLAMKKRRTA